MTAPAPFATGLGLLIETCCAVRDALAGPKFYVKVADAVCGVGYSRGYWTRRGAEQAAADLSREFAPAVWVLTRREKREDER